MKLRALSGEGWRNLAPFTLVPSGRVLVFHGDNGQGKTNLLEAIYFLATLRSFRTSDTREVIGHDAAAARLSADVEVGGLERRIEVELRPGQRLVTIDGKAARGAAAVFGGFNAVVFVPEDLLLPRATPAARRRFLDLVVFALDRAFWREAAAFQRVLRSRNAILRGGSVDGMLLDSYDEQLARAGARVVMRRRTVAAALGPAVAAAYQAIGGRHAADVIYVSAPEVEAAADEDGVRAALLAGFGARRGQDLRRGHATFGPHTDDLALRLDGRLAREHASQGQSRALVLALKLAEVSLLEARHGEPPVLLLDDVASELDAERRHHLFEKVAALTTQTFITVTDPGVVPPLQAREDFHVSAGRFPFTRPHTDAI